MFTDGFQAERPGHEAFRMANCSASLVTAVEVLSRRDLHPGLERRQRPASHLTQLHLRRQHHICWSKTGGVNQLAPASGPHLCFYEGLHKDQWTFQSLLGRAGETRRCFIALEKKHRSGNPGYVSLEWHWWHCRSLPIQMKGNLSFTLFNPLYQWVSMMKQIWQSWAWSGCTEPTAILHASSAFSSFFSFPFPLLSTSPSPSPLCKASAQHLDHSLFLSCQGKI